MNFATWSIRNPIPSIVIFALLSLAGLIGFNALGVKDFPDLDFPTVQATIALPGAAPSQLETEVARKVEDSLATVPGLKHMGAQITEGLVSFNVEFEMERDLSDALIDVKDAIERVRMDLPAAIEEPQVSKVTISPGGALVTYAVTSSRLDEQELSWFVDDTVARAVTGVRGVGAYSRVGGGTREVRVEVDPVRLAALGVTAADVSRSLRRMQQDASGGRGQLGGAEQGVRTVATVKQAAELAAFPIAMGDGRQVRLDQVATVTDTLAERTQAALLDGRPAVAFTATASKGYDELAIAEQISTALAALAVEHPDVRFERVSTTVENTRDQYQGSMVMLWEGAILAMIVVWVFLRNWRATLLGAIALPLSILPTFAVMHWAGYTLNTITLLALALVVGILVDDAIVEIENIERHVHQGKGVRQATEEAVTEIGMAVVATTLALVVVFLPTAFMSGVSGLIFRQFGWTVVAAVLASLLVARIVTPVMAVWLMRPLAHPAVQEDGPLMRRYMALARWCLRRRRIAMLGAVLFFAASLALVPLLPTGFVPEGDDGITRINLELAPGASLARTLAVAEEARRAIVDGDSPVPGVRSVFTTVGAARDAGADIGTAGDVRLAALTINLTERGTRPRQSEIKNLIRERLGDIAGARISVGTNGPGERLSIYLAGRDGALLTSTAATVLEEFRSIPGISGISSTASLERPELVVRPDFARAAEQGVTVEAIAETLRVATSGDFRQALPKLNLEGRQVDIRVRMAESARADLATIAGLRVPGRAGLVPLDAVADLTVQSGPSQIDRYDRNRFVSIAADLGGQPIGPALAAVQQLPTIRNLPAGVSVINTGDAEFMAELFGGFGKAMAIGVLCVYCVLVLLFKDFFQPVTILSAVPLSIGGAFVALLVLRSELGLPALIGLIMLLGIVTKNSILLVEYAIVGIRDRGLSEYDALLEACHKRARPIVMTTVAMVAGMVPLALGIGGGDGSFRRPMAVAVIGGLITSTGLSLLVIPVVFTYVARFERWLTGLVARRAANAPAQLRAANDDGHR